MGLSGFLGLLGCCWICERSDLVGFIFFFFFFWIAMVGGGGPQVLEQPPQSLSQPPSAAEEEAIKRNTDCVYFLASPLTCKKVLFLL